MTANELGEQLGVSRRTICRDIDALSAAGIPIYTERGKGGGVRLLPGFVLDKSLLTEQEQTEILSALQGLSNLKTDDTDQILQKLSGVFRAPTTNWLSVDLVAWGQENDFFNLLKSAIIEQTVVRFDYYNTYGTKRARQVEPVQVCFKGKAWYLKGVCLAKNEWRLYKLSRIRDLAVTQTTFVPRPIPQDDPSTQPCGEPIQLRIAQEMAYRVFDDFCESTVTPQPDGSFLILIDWPQNEWLYHFLLSFGQYVQVLQPPHLRDVIQEQAQKICALYE